jgi:hypothetical protein
MLALSSISEVTVVALAGLLITTFAQAVTANKKHKPTGLLRDNTLVIWGYIQSQDLERSQSNNPKNWNNSFKITTVLL